MTATATMVVIDDIRSVVEMIATKIDWESHGIEVVGRAGDGEQGFALVESLRPNIVLTDIRMPKLDGLRMTERIMQVLPDCKVIILSGYTDFEYARQAVRLGALDFVKKPFTVREIEGAVLKAKEAWMEEERQRASVDRLNRQVKESMPALRQEHLNMLVQSQSSPAKASELWRFLELGFEPEGVAVAVAEIDDYERKYAGQSAHVIELVRFSLQNVLEETIGGRARGTLFRESRSRFVLLLSAGSAEEALSIAEACCANIERFTKFTVSIGVGGATETIGDLPDRYRQACAALSYHFYTGGNAVFHYEAIERKEIARPAYSFKTEEKLVFALQSGNAAMVLDTLDGLIGELKEQRPLPDPGQVSGLFQLWASVVYRTLLEIVPSGLLSPVEERLLPIRTRSDLPLHELRSLIREAASEGCRLVLEERRNESGKQIGKAIAYIRGHLGEELTVDRCAKVVNLSGGYFANLFKKETGMTVVQFVTQERIEQAKKLLALDVPVQNIAQQLGYEHRRYFSDVFKKHTGMTPSEFKDHYRFG
ncbi:response regulator [Cohnella sp. GCM10027633]|uniref:response regulator n=1 Tax=unclassified Cohnella TaxID=2636738 RepID=UPI003636BF74